MKSPFKYSKVPIIASLIFNIFIFAELIFRYGISLGTIAAGLTILAISLFGSFDLAWSAGTLLHRKVFHPIHTKDLKQNETYWLNGQTAARYIGHDRFRNTFLFRVDGLNNPSRLADTTDFLANEVMQYFSSVKEM